MSSDWPVASALLAGRYRLVSLLETGGMAEIWRAEDELLDRPVAVKLPTGPQVVWREARMAAKLSHPGIAAVHDYREAVRPDGTVVPFVVMELLTGESVAARVDRELVGWAETARVGAAVADALAAAHASGVVHRDIKPGNVMLTPNGVKILDFGISVAAGEPDDDDTGATFGTPAYVAPERLDGMPAEPATDVYGVGVLLFEMVTGDPPYPVATWEELAAARVTGPSEMPESLPADFRDVVNRCLDADPARRPTAARLRADLLAVALRSRPPAPRQPPANHDQPSPIPSSAVPSSAVPSSAVPSSAVPSSAVPSSAVPSSGRGHEATASSSDRDRSAAASMSDRDRTAAASMSDRDQAAATSGADDRPVVASGAVGHLLRAAGPADPQRVESSPGNDPPAETGRAPQRPPRSSFAFTEGDDRRPNGHAATDGERRPPAGPGGSRRPRATRGFIPGRASAATIEMASAPRRRLAFGVGAAGVLAVLIGAFILITWTHRNTETDVAIPPPATAPALPTVTATLTPDRASVSPTSPGASSTATLTFADAVNRMRAAVKGGVADGQIRKDVAQDLLNLLGPLSTAQGSDVPGQIDALRRKIQTRVGEGGVTPARATVLQSRLADLDRAAGT